MSRMPKSQAELLANYCSVLAVISFTISREGGSGGIRHMTKKSLYHVCSGVYCEKVECKL